jgi:FkbM family methyltransferase
LRLKARRAHKILDRLIWRPNSAYLGDGRGLVVGRRGRAIIVELSDTNVLESLVARGVADEPFHMFLSTTLSGSDVYVDVGANIGQLVDTAARSLNSYGRVFAYEPNQRVADTLSLNVQLGRNSGAQAEVVERRVAVSDSTEPVTLRVPSFHAGRGSMVRTALSDVDLAKLDHHEVSCVTLDDELGHLSRIRLIKIDVEGNEAAVLAGATALVESGRVDLIDIESVRAHLGSSVVRLGAILDRWQDRGAKFADIGSHGRLIPIQQRASTIVTSGDRSHLIIDLRPIRAALQRS